MHVFRHAGAYHFVCVEVKGQPPTSDHTSHID